MKNQSYRPVDWVEEIVTRQKDKLFRTAIVIMKNKADAEDALQDVFIKLVEKSPQFESLEHETAWLMRVIINLCKSRLRLHWWKKVVPLLESYPEKDSGQHDITQAVLALPPNLRIAINLFYYHGYATKEIAEITQRKESTVRKDLTRARRLLKVFLEGEEHEKA